MKKTKAAHSSLVFLQMGNKVEEIIQNGLNYLTKKQEKNGSFLSFTTKNNFKDKEPRKSLFQNALILSALCNIDENKYKSAKKIKDKLAHYIKGQKDEQGLFNYWEKDSEESKKTPYPNDLDDTCCALSALHTYDPKLTTGETLAQMVNILTYLEVKEGGPYRTWVVPENSNPAWKDVDLAVNSNIAYFLSLSDVSLPNQVRFIDESIKSDTLHSPYYKGFYPILYFISRHYQGRYKTLLAGKLCRPGKEPKSVLESALAITALFNIGYTGKKLTELKSLLIKEVRKTNWEALPFVVESIKNQKPSLSGSGALTCAICLEALSTNQNVSQQNTKTTLLETEISKSINNLLITLTKNLDKDFKKYFKYALKNMLQKDVGGHISLLPLFFYHSLKGQLPSKHKKIIVQLGAANVLGWMAYTIYDDFLDNEGDPLALSTANFCLRQLTSIFEKVLPKNAAFCNFYNTIMNLIDEANFWETSNCRAKIQNNFLIIDHVPNYSDPKKLSNKSIGHALGPICLLFLDGKKENSADLKNTLLFFKYFIAAKQLNDDMHDWEEDIQKGMITLPVAKIIARLKKNQINITNLDPLRKVYWEEAIEELCQKIFEYVKKSRERLNKIESLKDREYFENLLIPIKKAAQTALLEKEKTIDFIKNY